MANITSERRPRPTAYGKRGKLELPRHVNPIMDAHRRYLEGRGFDVDQLVNLWGIQATSILSKPSWSVFIPIVYRGEFVSWTTRAIGANARTRYVSAKPSQEIYHHKDLLYGEDLCGTSIAVLEGPLDVWAVGPGATCTFGTNFTRAQVRKIANYPNRVICYDSTREGQMQARRLCQALAAFPGTTTNVVLDAKDAAETNTNERNQLKALLL